MRSVSRNDKNRINELISKIIDQEIKFDQADQFYLKKRNALEKLAAKENLEERDFAELQELSITKDGFLSNTFRRNLWKKILNVKGHNNLFEFVVLSTESEKKMEFDQIYKADQSIIMI
jgi:hypothetical protein